MATVDTALNEKQEEFCKMYTSHYEVYWNATQAYILVYKPDKTKSNWYNTASASATRLIKKPHIQKRVNELLQDGGLNELNVDKQLAHVLNQHHDLNAKLAAIKHFDNRNARIEKARQSALTAWEITTDVLTIKLPE